MSKAAQSYDDYVDKIHYSDRYSDDEYEYRHVILPKGLLKLIPKDFFMPGGSVLRLLSDSEWRGIGITQSVGWQHYEVHHPEPHILLFRREQDYQKKYGAQGRPEDQPTYIKQQADDVEMAESKAGRKVKR